MAGGGGEGERERRERDNRLRALGNSVSSGQRRARGREREVDRVPVQYRGTSLVRNRTPPKGPHRALGIVLLQGPRGRRFLMSEVPL